MPKSYELTNEERQAVQDLLNGITAAKLEVCAANVVLEDARTRVATAVRNAELAEAKFAAGVSLVANIHGITSGSISQDLTRIEESK